MNFYFCNLTFLIILVKNLLIDFIKELKNFITKISSKKLLNHKLLE